jgi:hypothetical protein
MEFREKSKALSLGRIKKNRMSYRRIAFETDLADKIGPCLVQ